MTRITVVESSSMDFGGHLVKRSLAGETPQGIDSRSLSTRK